MSKLLVPLLFLLPTAGLAQSDFELSGGAEIQAYLGFPEAAGNAPTGAWPLVVVMGGGPGSEGIASGAFSSVGQEFIRRGWAVVAPVSPNGQSFWGDNAEKVRQLISVIKAREAVDKGPVLLVGVSNGGISALEIASRHPQEYLGVVAVPAIASDASQLHFPQNFPVYLRIGSNDRLAWNTRFDTTVQTLSEAGAKVDALLLEGFPHTFPLDWPSLEPWLATIRPR
ncbi:MAG: hypothetical protein RQ899_03975 [Pseudomonadales bacterium]|nr:hypothetical protein [Pseudomonadales bacterium]